MADRNAFQQLIDTCTGSKIALTRLHNFIGETIRSINDAMLAAPAGSERQRMLEQWKKEATAAHREIDRLQGW